MTDEVLESGQSAGSSGTPNPSPSSTEGASPSSTGTQAQASLDALMDQVKRLAGEVNALKSGKDKGIQAVQNQVSDVRERLARYEQLRSKGVEPAQAMEEAEFGDPIERQFKALNERLNELVAGRGTGSSVSGSTQAAQAFVQVGLDITDPDVAIALSEVEGKTLAEQKLAAYELRDRKASQPNPTRAQSSSTTKREPPAPNLEGLRAEYEKELEKFRGNPAGTADLKARYRKKGLANLW